MRDFYFDISKNLKVTWCQLIDDINKCTEYNPYCNYNDDYLIFKQMQTTDKQHKIKEKFLKIFGFFKDYHIFGLNHNAGHLCQMLGIFDQ